MGKRWCRYYFSMCQMRNEAQRGGLPNITQLVLSLSIRVDHLLLQLLCLSLRMRRSLVKAGNSIMNCAHFKAVVREG